MQALVTGASSGIGREIARILSERGYDIIAVARRKDRLVSLANELKTKTRVIDMDLSNTDNCIRLFEMLKDEDIEIVINNAGFGAVGDFAQSNIDTDNNMIDLNCKALHIVMRLFLEKFMSENRGYILNVCSIAGFMPGPLMATYYATKAFVLSLTRSVLEEVTRSKKNIYIGCLCPGPVDTEFSNVANVKFSLKSKDAKRVANYAIDKMFCGKHTILPGFEIKIAAFFSKIIPVRIMSRICYNVQRKKIEK